ncbi:MAG: T9SS C-terminal target domain-containing protein [Crocinitomicaceae bacterium]|nr:T9SS C-terminal target domain-containing protein [Crocinitomicaceae bacterium]
MNVYPNPSNDILMVQISDLLKQDLELTLIDAAGRVVAKRTIFQGSTIAYFDVSTLYKGIYFLKTNNGQVLEVSIND